MREETEDWRKDTMKEELGKDTPGENSQNTYTEEHEFDIWGMNVARVIDAPTVPKRKQFVTAKSVLPMDVGKRGRVPSGCTASLGNSD